MVCTMRRIRSVVSHICPEIPNNQCASLSPQAAAGTPPISARALPGPLSGIRVIDMSTVISGPWAASFLTDQGADVIKVEPPDGPDMTRGLGPGPVDGLASMYVTANRGKRSVTINLHSEQGVAVLKRLALHCDVVIQNYRPGVAERLKVDYKTLAAVNPNLIFLSITGYGHSGPYKDAPVYDQVIQAMSGVGTIAKDPAGGPSLFYNLLMDKVTAMNAAQSVTAALLARERGRGGQYIELSMLDSAVHFLFPDGYLNAVWMDVEPGPYEWSDLQAQSVCPASDGKVAVSVGNAKQMTGILAVTGLDEKAYGTKSWLELRTLALPDVQARFQGMTKKEIFDGCLKHDVPCGVFNNLQEVFQNAQVKNNGTVLEEMHPGVGRFRAPKPPARFSKTPSAVQGPAPSMGAHNDEVLHDFGYTAEEVDALRMAGAIGR